VSRAIRIYPARGAGGRRAMLGDLSVVLLILLFAWIGLRLHDAIGGLGEMARGVRDTGVSIERTGAETAREIRDGFGSAADTIASAPLVGGSLSSTLRSTGERSAAAVERQARETGRELAGAGRDGERDARSVARLVGWLGFLVPTVLLLSQALPTRLRQVRGLRAP
jgi:hypothetical protein